jgi:hypothetical protein
MINNNQKYIDRLFNEWLKYGRIIIGLDFDSTISPWPTIDNMDDMQRCIKLVLRAQELGCYIVIHTSCNSERYDEIKEWCNTHDIKINTINRNPIDLPYGKEAYSKPMCNIYLDDRAGFNESMYILEKAIELYNSHKYKERTNFYPDVA